MILTKKYLLKSLIMTDKSKLLIIKSPSSKKFCDACECLINSNIQECEFVIEKQKWVSYGIYLENNCFVLEKYFDHSTHTCILYFDLLDIYARSKIINKHPTDKIIKNIIDTHNTTFIDYIEELINFPNKHNKFNQSIGTLMNKYIKNSIFKDIDPNTNQDYKDWYITIDGAGGVNCVLFSNGILDINNIKVSKSIYEFTLEELNDMLIHYKAWLENCHFKTHREVILELYKYCCYLSSQQN